MQYHPDQRKGLDKFNPLPDEYNLLADKDKKEDSQIKKLVVEGYHHKYAIQQTMLKLGTMQKTL